MSNGNGKSDWSGLYTSEDWWACWLGWFILVLAILATAGVANLLPAAPKIGKWAGLDFAKMFPAGASTLWAAIKFFAFCCVLTCIAGVFAKFDLKNYVPGFLVIFIISLVAMVLSKQSFMHKWGIEYVLFALIIGLIISNLFTVPQFLRAGGQTEFFVKIGLVCMGATIMFSDLLKGGAVGLIQALVVATVVWFMTYFICRAFKVSEKFSAIIATANSICGVSATIAAGGAIQGDPKEVSYMVAWVLVCAVVLILIMPPIAIWLNLSPAWAGAWVGGVIDNTGAVIAASEVIGASSTDPTAKDVAVKAAAMVKMSQNVLIGFVAFLMALWATLSLERKERADAETPSLMEVWYRFPKFVLGFVVSSIIVSLLVEPTWGAKAAKACGKALKPYRNWFFAFCFVAIGLETNFKELVSVGGGRPAIAYWIAQTANAFWTLLVAYVLWEVIFKGTLG